MCGFVGIFNSHRPLPRGRTALLHRMLDSIAHRGPDGEQFYIDGHIGLGFRRLAIIDVGGGAQPLQNEDGQLRLVVNGEIYNYKSMTAALSVYGHRFHVFDSYWRLTVTSFSATPLERATCSIRAGRTAA